MSSRVGEKRLMNCGMEAEIITYRSAKDIDVRFKDGSIRFSVAYGNFKRGTVSKSKRCVDSNHRLGERRAMNCGLVAEIIAYRSAKDIDVRFDDGFTAYNRIYLDFKRGNINSLNCVSNRAGEKRVMNYGMEAEIIAYRDARDIDIEFEDGTVVEHRYYSHFQNGTIRHPNFIIGHYKGTLSSFTVEKLAYKLKDARDVFYICECQKCKLRDILTPREMLDHKCEVITSEQVKK